MKVNEQAFTRWFQYSIEMIFVYILTTPFHMFHKTLPSFWAFFLICGLGVLPYVLIMRNAKSINIAVIYIITLVIGVIVFILGQGQILYLVYTAVMGWRIAEHYKEPDQFNEKTIFYLTLSLGIAVFCLLALLGFEDKNLILVLVVFQMVFILTGRILKDILTNNGNQKLTLKDLRLPLIIFSIMTITAALGTMLFNIVKGGTIFLLTWIMKGVTLLFYPLFMIFEGIEFQLPQSSEQGETETTFLDQIRQNQEEQVVQSNTLEIVILVILGIILVALLIYFTRKKLFVSSMEDEKQPLFIRESNNENGLKDQLFSKLRRSKPTHKIRKQFFDLERFAFKKGVGRKTEESVLEWFNRIGLQENTEEMAFLYGKVRYGHIELTEKEAHLYETKIKGLKAEINQVFKKKENDL